MEILRFGELWRFETFHSVEGRVCGMVNAVKGVSYAAHQTRAR